MSARGAGRAVSLSVSCRVRGHNKVGRAHDLTRESCLLDLGNGFIAAGDNLALRFACGVRLNGRVSLVHGRITRVEFEQRLHQAIYEHLTSSEGMRSASGERHFDRAHNVASGAPRLG